ncbi:hypothetical protein [Thiobacillus sp.]
MTRKNFLAATILLAAAIFMLFRWPWVTVIEFEARGESGDEVIRVNANKDEGTLLHDSATGRQWKKYRFEQFWIPENIRIYFMNPPVPNGPARVLYIDNGIVKLYRLNVFGDVLSRKDILNIDSRYLGLDGKPLFEVDSAPMATIRGGITGWAGFYDLYPEVN